MNARQGKTRRFWAVTAVSVMAALALSATGLASAGAAPAGTGTVATPPSSAPATDPGAGVSSVPWTSGEATDAATAQVTDPPPPPAAPYGEFTPVTPTRILDTRDGTGQPFSGPIGQGITRTLAVAGAGGVPSSGAIAVVLNVTVDQPNFGGWIAVWPTGATRPGTSTVNFSKNQTVPNLVTVALGTNGTVNIYNFAGNVHVIGDVMGYYSGSSGPAGSRYHPTTAHRIVDSRLNQVAIGPRVAGSVTPIDFGAGHGILATPATAVVLNLTVTDVGDGGFYTVYPNDSSPTTSNLNFAPGTIRANQVIVRVPADGIVNVKFTGYGQAALVVDIAGYFDNVKTTDAGRFIPITPYRSLDTRDAPGYAPNENQSKYVTPLGDGKIPSTGVSGVVFNLTATAATFGGFLSVYPGDAPTVPTVSNVNFGPNQDVPNHVIAGLSTSANGSIPAHAFLVYNKFGTTQFIIDAYGYFTG